MDYSVEEIQPNVWCVRVGTVTRIIRFRTDSMTFAPWDVTSAEGQVLWSAASLASAFRWIQARTGYPVEALFAQSLLERSTGMQPAANATPRADGAADGRHAVGDDLLS
jgi:hypothetical protein